MKNKTKQTARKAAKKIVRYLGRGGAILLVLALAVGLAAGAGVGYFLSRENTVELVDYAPLELTEGERYDYADLLFECKAVFLGKDVSDRVTVTPSFEVAEDGSVTLEAGTYYISYRLDVLFGLRQVEQFAAVTVLPAEGGNAHG
ncbi:MAG: hypothetical protein IJC29_03715 [Clostridia bacterium]|nr:hypothetical protein [Clostridia bacterium]